MDSKLVYTGADIENWFFSRYYYNGANSRYYTFQIAMNLLHQRHNDPMIIETGCQRQEEDLGAGMSTSIFAEYIDRYGGSLMSIDNNIEHLRRADQYLAKWPNINAKLVCSCSVQFLTSYEGPCDLLYLDSLDYPIAENEGNVLMQKQAQQHCLNELVAAEKNLRHNSIVLLDDNQLGGGGKPALAKQFLIDKGWTCILDLQSTLWIKSL